MQSISQPTRAGRRSGFSLIELLVVILIIAILSGIILTAIGGSDNARALDSGITRMDGLFSLARSAAITRKQTTRLLINFDDTNLNALDKPQRMLRYAIIVYLDDDGLWKLYSQGEFLPAGVYFSPALSTKSEDTDALYTWVLDIDENSLDVTQPVDPALTPVGPYALSGNEDTLNHVPAADKWYAYEFASNGTSRNPGKRMVLVSGSLQSANKLQIPSEDGVDVTDTAKGFVVFRSGKVQHFSSGQQIKEGN